MEKPYTLLIDASYYAYSRVLTQAAESPDDLRPIVYISGLLSNRQQRWSATKTEALSVYQFVLKFEFYLRGTECTFHCHHKQLEPFLSKGIKIPKLNRWSMELADYNITFIYIKGETMF